ncbi:MAG: hypothetical protein MUE85_01215 [Microscillaceae bacterium]|jgi:DNA-directed RNA polymerase subunit F|nr:hypothetical protein [Microscillaceae bacterium]
MINQANILKSIREILEKYPQDVSNEHIMALLELYADNKLKKLKTKIVNEIKDVLETDSEQISKEQIQQLIQRVLALQ